MEYVLAAAVVAVVVVFVSVPLRRPKATPPQGGGADDPRLAELEARKEAKYREIRDTELDREQGKLSEEDFHRQDAELRREAIGILEELDRIRGGS